MQRFLRNGNTSEIILAEALHVGTTQEKIDYRRPLKKHDEMLNKLGKFSLPQRRNRNDVRRQMRHSLRQIILNLRSAHYLLQTSSRPNHFCF